MLKENSEPNRKNQMISFPFFEFFVWDFLYWDVWCFQPSPFMGVTALWWHNISHPHPILFYKVQQKGTRGLYRLCFYIKALRARITRKCIRCGTRIRTNETENLTHINHRGGSEINKKWKVEKFLAVGSRWWTLHQKPCIIFGNNTVGTPMKKKDLPSFRL
jgi:hypothetical protein